jgi:hypothetical protein
MNLSHAEHLGSTHLSESDATPGSTTSLATFAPEVPDRRAAMGGMIGDGGAPVPPIRCRVQIPMPLWPPTQRGIPHASCGAQFCRSGGELAQVKETPAGHTGLGFCSPRPARDNPSRHTELDRALPADSTGPRER